MAIQPKQGSGVMIALILLLGVALVATIVVTGGRSSARELQIAPISPSNGYQNDDYVAPAPDLHPPAVVTPSSSAQAKQLLEANSLYAQTVPRPIRCSLSTVDATKTPKDKLQAHSDQVTACLMKQWASVLKAAGYLAVRPSVTVYDTTAQTACGQIDSQNASYCEDDQQVYFATDLVDVLPPKVATSRLMVDAVLAHEFGHAIQARTGILASANLAIKGVDLATRMLLNRRAELQADCLAGLYVGSLVKSMEISADELATVTELFASSGDDVGWTPPLITRGHGSSASRAHWVDVGLKANPAVVGVCNTWTAPEDLVD